MKSKKNNTALLMVISLSLVLLFAGCPEEPEEDLGIGEITRTGIPAAIPVWDKANKKDRDDIEPNDTFKVYLNASNSMSPSVAPEAKGLIKVSPETLQNDGTHTVTMRLQNPNPGFGKPEYNTNPNLDTGSWSGTASFFSITICPRDTVPNGIDAIWTRAGYTLNKGKKTIAWNGLSVNFRTSTIVTPSQINALYDDIVCKDPEIITE
jgi:hypothetical protein